MIIRKLPFTPESLRFFKMLLLGKIFTLNILVFSSVLRFHRTSLELGLGETFFTNMDELFSSP